jgi:hypothetical protein
MCGLTPFSFFPKGNPHQRGVQATESGRFYDETIPENDQVPTLAPDTAAIDSAR